MGDVELHEDQKFQRREWRIQRLGWVLILVMFGAAAVGLLGYGPLSTAVVVAGDSEVRYPRIGHREKTDELHVTGGGSSIRLGGPWLDGVEIEQVIPEPQAMRSDQGGLILEFGRGPVDAAIAYRASDYGVMYAHVDVGSQRLRLTQWVLP